RIRRFDISASTLTADESLKRCLRASTTMVCPSLRLFAASAALPCWLMIWRRNAGNEPENGALLVPMPASAEKVNDALVRRSCRKFGRVGSPDGVSGEVL